MVRVIATMAAMLASSVAHADDSVVEEDNGREVDRAPDGYIAAGGIFGEDQFQYQGIAIELGRRIEHMPVFGRAMASAGNTKLERDPGRGTYLEARVGAEARGCFHDGRLCVSGGIDAGKHRGRYTHLDLSQRKPS